MLLLLLLFSVLLLLLLTLSGDADDASGVLLVMFQILVCSVGVLALYLHSHSLAYTRNDALISDFSNQSSAQNDDSVSNLKNSWYLVGFAFEL